MIADDNPVALFVCLSILGFGMVVSPGAASAALSDEEEVVDYAAEFFQQYAPDTALDMIRQLPGFQIDDGGDKRGFGGAAGNVLIDGRRPSAKQDPPSAILRRIPAAIVESIELIRGQVRGLDSQGHSVLANILLQEDAPAAVRWDASFRKHSNVTPIRGEGSISISDRWQAVDYSAGISGFRATFGDEGIQSVYDGSGSITERRYDDAMVVNLTGNAYLNASAWLGATLLNANASVGYTDRDELLTSNRVPAIGNLAARDVFFGDKMTTRHFELGLDAERALTNNVLGKAIFLLYGSGQEKTNDQRTIELTGDQSLFRVADSMRDTTEAISRMELDWSRWANHAIQADFEVAYNMLDNSLARLDDTGNGPVAIPVPGANARVEELRFDMLVQDTWSVSAWSLNYGLGVETSTISQSGDANQKRRFFFLKPQAMVTWAPLQTQQTRLRVAREVAQLNFNDFVSATVFLDDDLALGNPDLQPESTWISELTHERRLGDLAVVSLTAFHHWIADVQDLLPITSQFEAPGNIGDGRRWGLEMQSTVPLEALGWTGARMDIKGRWQDSSVTDPVTGERRNLTAAGGFSGVPTTLPFRNENEYAYSINYRQDFQDSRIAWGWGVTERGERPRFKVNELDVYNEEDPVVDLFIETTRWWDIKIGFDINNLLDLTASRERTVYTGRRGISPVGRREIREYSVGRRYSLSISGSF
ncbi:MAG: TonB-dependent receptor [Woeseia sp.]